mgnify:CR=1 FL=1
MGSRPSYTPGYYPPPQPPAYRPRPTYTRGVVHGINRGYFRRQIAAFIGDLAHKGKQFKWDSNPKLKKALEMKLFEDVKDTIKLSALNVSGATVVDKDIQEKIDALKTRLIRQYGYNERSATDVLDFVGGIFARGDLADEE